MTLDATRAAALVETLVNPRSVVVVGASSDPSKSSSRPLRYLAEYGYAGDVSAVNPRRSQVLGFPAVPNIGAVGAGGAQAAVVNLGAPAVTDALRELEAIGVQAAVVIGSGFERDDSEPRRALLDFLASEPRIRVIGPNCVGTMSTGTGAHLNFSSVLQDARPRRGSVALVTQSGATGNGILMSLLRRGLGISHWFSTGNELNVGALELTAGLLQRDDVTCVGLFLEGITDIAWLPVVSELLRKTGKRIYAVKIADSDLGRAAAGGHTGRVVGSADISRAVLAEAGFVRCANIAELCDCLIVDQVTRTTADAATAAARRTLSVASVSGASAVIISDNVHAARDLDLAEWDDSLLLQLTELSNDRITHPVNPLDVPFLGETRTFAGLVSAIAESRQGDITVAVESSLAHARDELLSVLAERSVDANPIVLTHLSEDDLIEPAVLAELADARVAVIPTPERAVTALNLTSSGATPETAAARTPHPKQQAEDEPPAPRSARGLEQLSGVLPSQFPWARWTVTEDLPSARQAADAYGFPVAVKAAGRTITHRSELGAVAFIRNPADFADAYARVAAVCAEHGDAVIVQEAAPPGREVLLAGLRDPEYGPAAIVRMGGVLVELLSEQVVIWSGWAPEHRRAVLRSSTIGAILAGYRGGAAGDLGSLAAAVDDVLATLAATDLDLLELNPIMVLPEGIRAVDALGYGSA